MKRSSDAHDFSHSLTDLMAGVAVTFLIIAAIFIVQAARSRVAAEHEAQAMKEFQRKFNALESNEQSARRELDELAAKLGELKIRTQRDPDDPLLLRIIFQSETLFRPNECVPAAGHVEVVGQVYEAFRAVCSDSIRAHLHSIVLEGHTDRKPFSGGSVRCGSVDVCESADCVEQGFQNNVRLSASRAQEVFFQARRQLLNSPDASIVESCLDQYFSVVGRGPVEPVRKGASWRKSVANGEELAQDRRVVLKVRAKTQSALTFEKDPAP